MILEKVASAEDLDYLFIKSRGESENSIAFLESDMNQAAIPYPTTPLTGERKAAILAPGTRRL